MNKEPYKVALFLTRDPALPASEFTTRWLGAGAPAIGEGLLAHTHNAPAMAETPIENAPPAPFDGVDEYLFTSAAQAQVFLASPAFRDGWLAPRLPYLAGPLAALSGTAWTVWNREGPQASDSVKILTLPVRRTGMAMDEFADYWINRHFPLAISGPGTAERLRQAVTCPADGLALPQLQSAPFDGIGTIVFDSIEALQAEFSSDHYRESLAPDEPRFTDPADSRAMMVREFSVFQG